MACGNDVFSPYSVSYGEQIESFRYPDDAMSRALTIVELNAFKEWHATVDEQRKSFGKRAFDDFARVVKDYKMKHSETDLDVFHLGV